MEPPMEQRHLAASDILQGVIEQNTADSITFHELKVSLHERGFGILILIFALPLGFVPPGFTIIASIPTIIFSIQMILALDSPWLPKWIEKKSIKRTMLATIIEKSSPILKWTEKFVRARWYFGSSRFGERIVGIFSLIFSISIGIPLPFTNFLPALGMVIMALGLVSKDGLAIILGIIIGMVGCILTFLILTMGKRFATDIFSWIMMVLT